VNDVISSPINFFDCLEMAIRILDWNLLGILQKERIGNTQSVFS